MNNRNNNRSDDVDDEKISSLVRSVKFKIPGYVERRIDDAIDLAVSQQSVKQKNKRLVLWYPLSAAAAIAIIIVLLILQPFAAKNPPEPNPQITEIKTQFELKDKNIKILWVQKKDFELKSHP